jgi:hypothetical protein
MKNNLDQLEQELMEWDERERKYEKLFGKATIIGRTFQKEKLAVFERLETKYGNIDSDRIGSLMLRQRRKEIERIVYPGRAIRFLYHLAKAILPAGKAFAYEKNVQNNLKNLHKQVSGAGFNIPERRLEQMIRQGNREDVIPVSYFVNQAEKMDFELKFSKDASGMYAVDQYQARYQNLSGDKETRACAFNHGQSPDVTARQAYNLLAGRAARVGEEQAHKHWIQLDFNDKDAMGNYRLKVFPPDYGFDLSRVLEDKGIIESMDYFSKFKLAASVENGDRVTIAQDKGPIEIEADPQKKTVNVFEHGELRKDENDKSNLKELKTERERALMKVVKPLKAKGIHK